MSQSITLSSFVSADQIPNPASLTTRLEEVLEIDKELVELQNRIKSLGERREYVIQEHLSAGVQSEGPLFIGKKVTKRDTLDPDAFAHTYPEEFRALYQEIGESKFKPSKSDASKVLTSYQVEKVCKRTESITYSVDFDIHQGAEL